MRRAGFFSTTVVLVALLAPGCAVRQAARTPTLSDDLARLQADLGVLPPFPEPAPGAGSLWTARGFGASLVRDKRAFRINDLVTILLQESTTGSNSSNTDLTRSASANYVAPFVFGLEKDRILDVSHDSDFSGDGSTTRQSNLIGTLTARVVRVLPNGDLIVAGQKTVMVNREKQILTAVGSIRPVDVRSNNRVPSSSVGDLTVRMWGTGEIDDTVRQGWFMRVMNRLWPF